ncbi:MAG: OsmC family peroxiredoxin [Paracoccaceae bacterium]
MIKKFGNAEWSGNLKEGKGRLSSESGALSNLPYGFNTRFEDQAGTNPEELIGAAHAACFSMALSNILGSKDIVPGKIETRSVISLSMDGGPQIVGAHLVVAVQADGDKDVIRACAEEAETGCPVSKVLDCPISMELTVL